MLFRSLLAMEMEDVTVPEVLGLHGLELTPLLSRPNAERATNDFQEDMFKRTIEENEWERIQKPTKETSMEPTSL